MKVFHKCPTKDQLKDQDREIKHLKKELTYEEKRRTLAEWELTIERNKIQRGYYDKDTKEFFE